MKEFCIHVDVTMSGNVYINANSKDEAMEKLQEMNFTSSDLNGFYQVDTVVVDIDEEY